MPKSYTISNSLADTIKSMDSKLDTLQCDVASIKNELKNVNERVRFCEKTSFDNKGKILIAWGGLIVLGAIVSIAISIAGLLFSGGF